jgi:glycosyltransferase involved in cell wall biosynthesis
MSINYYAPINLTGYGIASLNILKSLYTLCNQNISYFPIGSPSISNQQDYDFVKQILSENIRFDPKAPCIKIWHQFDLANRIGSGEYLAYPFFELDTFNQLELKHLTVPDRLIASSNWAKEVFINNGISCPIDIVPLGVDLNIFDHKLNTTTANNNYVFLTIGKWEIRKGHDILPDIFNKAFPNQKDVELWILAAEHTNGYSKPEEIQAWKKMYTSDRIKVIPGLPSHQDIAQLIAQSSCGLYVSRAEGWNLELLETMAMNKPAIATNYSAHTEFCNTENCLLVEISEIEPAYDGKAFVGQGNWAKIGQNQIDQTIDYMRYVYNNRINTNLAGLKTANRYSWQNSAECMYRCINK